MFLARFHVMTDSSSPNVTNLLVAWGKGDPNALEELIPQVWKELHRLAIHYMAAERPGHVLQATALVNEAYLRLVDWEDVQWTDRAHFFGIAANMMRRVLVDYARNRDRAKRGGDAIQVSLVEALNKPGPETADVLALEEVLQRLEQLDARKSQIVEMRFFQWTQPGGNRRSPRCFRCHGETGLDSGPRLAAPRTQEKNPIGLSALQTPDRRLKNNPSTT